MGVIAGVYQLDGSEIGSGLTKPLKQVADTSPGLKLKYWSSGPVAFIGSNIVCLNRQSHISDIFRASLTDDPIVIVDTGFHGDQPSLGAYANQLYTDVSGSNPHGGDNIEVQSSLAVWDHSNRILICYRDQLGCDPLYYTYAANRYFVFASTMQTILHIMSNFIEPRLNRAQAVGFLIGRPSEAGQTFFRHINRLSAAHKIQVNGLGIAIHRYWTPQLQTNNRYKDKEYCNIFRELFVRSVARACNNSYHIGVLLSGGIDSSLVACVAADLLQKGKFGHLQSFTNLYGNEDERYYANLVVTQKKLEAHFLQTEDIDIFDSINEYIINTEEPFAHPGYLAIGKSFKVARHKSVKLLLDGSLGDSVISYNPRFIEEYLRKGSIFTGLREAVLFSRRMQGGHSSQLSFFWQRGVIPLFRSVLASDRPSSQSLENAQLTLPNFVRDQNAVSDAGRKRDSNYHLSFPMRAFLEATNSANTEVLERRFKLGMANEIKFTTPFADKDLVIFCSNLPPEQRVRDGWNRFIVRKSFQDSMPSGIINRGGKFASTSSVKAQLRRALTPERQIEIIETCKVLDHIIEHKALVGAVRRLTTPDTDVQLRDVISVWSSFSLARWMELFSVAG